MFHFYKIFPSLFAYARASIPLIHCSNSSRSTPSSLAASSSASSAARVPHRVIHPLKLLHHQRDLRVLRGAHRRNSDAAAPRLGRHRHGLRVGFGLTPRTLGRRRQHHPRRRPSAEHRCRRPRARCARGRLVLRDEATCAIDEVVSVPALRSLPSVRELLLGTPAAGSHVVRRRRLWPKGPAGGRTPGRSRPSRPFTSPPTYLGVLGWEVRRRGRGG